MGLPPKSSVVKPRRRPALRDPPAVVEPVKQTPTETAAVEEVIVQLLPADDGAPDYAKAMRLNEQRVKLLLLLLLI